MSRIGNRLLKVPANVTVEVIDDLVVVKGPKGELNTKINKDIKVSISEEGVKVERLNDAIPTKKIHGTINANINNLLIGVSVGYKKGLEIIGVGYKFNVSGNQLVINAGYSHPVKMEIPKELKVEQKSNTEIEVSGIDKILVGEFAANIRKVKKPEPYKGKGIRYIGEYVRRKEGKKAK